MLVIALVATVVVGPDKLPGLARQAGWLIRQMRVLGVQARDDLRLQLGCEFAGLELTDLDPRQLIRKRVAEVIDEVEQMRP